MPADDFPSLPDSSSGRISAALQPSPVPSVNRGGPGRADDAAPLRPHGQSVQIDQQKVREASHGIQGCRDQLAGIVEDISKSSLEESPYKFGPDYSSEWAGYVRVDQILEEEIRLFEREFRNTLAEPLEAAVTSYNELDKNEADHIAQQEPLRGATRDR